MVLGTMAIARRSELLLDLVDVLNVRENTLVRSFSHVLKLGISFLFVGCVVWDWTVGTAAMTRTP
jgi:hypothetical protein